MARIIDKEEKRLEIARASINLFSTKGIAQTSMDEIAKSAGVAKGTVYLYFKNKEEIIFAIWDMFSQQHEERYVQRITKNMSAKEKILEFYNFTACEEEHDREQILTLYQHFVSAMLMDKTGLYTAYFESFFQKDYDVISSCLLEGKTSGEFSSLLDVPRLSEMIIIFMKGVLIKAKIKNFHFEEAQSFLTEYITFILEHYTRKTS